jgi:hypothetical protein
MKGPCDCTHIPIISPDLQSNWVCRNLKNKGRRTPRPDQKEHETFEGSKPINSKHRIHYAGTRSYRVSPQTETRITNGFLYR